MITIIEDEGNELKVITQQYVSGLYVAIYKGDELVDQFGLEETEEDFHRELRVNYKYDKERSTLWKEII